MQITRQRTKVGVGLGRWRSEVKPCFDSDREGVIKGENFAVAWPRRRTTAKPQNRTGGHTNSLASVAFPLRDAQVCFGVAPF